MNTRNLIENPKRTLLSSRVALFCALVLAGASAFTTIGGMYELYYLAGATTVLLICTGIEVVRISSIYFLSLYWKALNKGFRAIGLFLVMVACLISAVGTSSFFMSAYNKQTNKVQPHQIQVAAKEEQIKALNRENQAFQEEVSRLRELIQDDRDKLSRVSVDEFGNLPREHSTLTNNITWRQNQSNNRSQSVRANEVQIRQLQSEISQLRVATIEDAPELSRLVPIGNLFGFSDPSSMISFLTILLVIAFDPLALWIMLLSTRLRKMVNEHEAEILSSDKSLQTQVVADMSGVSEGNKSVKDTLNLIKRGVTEAVKHKLFERKDESEIEPLKTPKQPEHKVVVNVEPTPQDSQEDSNSEKTDKEISDLSKRQEMLDRLSKARAAKKFKKESTDTHQEGVDSLIVEETLIENPEEFNIRIELTETDGGTNPFLDPIDVVNEKNGLSGVRSDPFANLGLGKPTFAPKTVTPNEYGDWVKGQSKSYKRIPMRNKTIAAGDSSGEGSI